MIENKLRNSILNNPNDIYYSYANTLFNAKLNLQSEQKKNFFKLFLSVLNKYKFENYFLFAGSSIGLYRDENSVPWCDDYDIIIMEHDFDYFLIKIMPELKKYSFIGYYAANNMGLYHIICHSCLTKTKYFQIDIFISYFHDDKLFNINHKYSPNSFKGLYSGKLNKIDILPPSKKLFDGIEVNFFNNVENEIKICYGDIINKIKIHINHDNGVISFDEKFSKIYKIFNELINEGKQNINKIIENYEYINIVKLKDIKFTSYIEFLKYLKEKKCRKIINIDNINLYYFPEIKYFLKNIEIVHLFINEDNFISPELFNYCDAIKFKNNFILNEYKKFNYFNSTLKFEIINVITFGTFDLLHEGHINIFYKCKKYSENLIVGVSSDKLNECKGKKSIETENERMNNIINLKHVNFVFLEESLEEKNEYINKYEADILITGDDWIGKFDWVDCVAIYVPRTQNISTTLLKKNKNTRCDIAHGGGSIDNFLYSNSLESLLLNKDLFNFIELDIVVLEDSFGVAHDGTEKTIYNSSINFKEMNNLQFENLSCYEKYSILTFEKLNQIMNSNPQLNIIFDTKFQNEQFCYFVEFIKQKINNINSIYFQVYNMGNCVAMKESGLKNVLFALWKNFNNNYSDEKALNILNYCHENLNIFGVSIDLKYQESFLNSALYNLTDKYNINVFYHKCNNIIDILDKNKYFVDDYKSILMKKMFIFEPNFNVDFYMNNYSDLKKAFGNNEIDYYSHYFYNGFREKRKYCENNNLFSMFDYYLPHCFKLNIYKEYQDLVNAFEECDEKYVSHFLAHGFFEKRKYF